ncbi:hypothetical protein HYQ45_002347 [Verticillium longisporum]|uniref:Uncharacterized protein n=3 Tax=Verticillium TaxID=1036719 RepID=A0A366P6C9_VERDA|nr:hypothetical protein VdG1_00043 [Verticillium dahliae VDG1]KAG7140966.1 hypothetical protein HYQ45_002347 [Verticillium longisporum]PNH45651.1 hypothetical protein VD0004_g2282 [Verticillium dahliae]PNH75166.1 hypothetical protein VD0001_g2406 [Verticillium dahliae]RBQ88140.1 hypothetical protein VDGD_20660 [Verticillium dahliae]
MASDVPRASGGSKILAFLDIIVKLAATGALIGILVMLLKINDTLVKVVDGDNVINVGLRYSGSSPLPISAVLENGFSPIGINIESNLGEGPGRPVWIRNAVQ